MKTYYISTNPDYYGVHTTSKMAYAEAEEIADAIEGNFLNMTTTLVYDNAGCNDLDDKEINEVFHWIEKNWVDILNNVGIY
jgi:hypothetical protein